MAGDETRTDVVESRTDIDYMNQYRDFDNDQRTFPYDEGQQFLQRLHDSGRHYVPIVDSAIYVPNPENASDAYPVFDAGNNSNSFLRNIDGSLMIGDVWPGKMTRLPSGETKYRTNTRLRRCRLYGLSGLALLGCRAVVDGVDDDLAW